MRLGTMVVILGETPELRDAHAHCAPRQQDLPHREKPQTTNSQQPMTSRTKRAITPT